MSWLLAIWPLSCAGLMVGLADYWNKAPCSLRLPTDHNYWASTLAGLSVGMVVSLIVEHRNPENKLAAAVFMGGLFATSLWWFILQCMSAYALLTTSDASPLPLGAAPFVALLYLCWGWGECRRLRPRRVDPKK